MQIISPSPIERKKLSPQFWSVGIDLFGSHSVKGGAQKRTRGNGYGVIIACS